MKAGFPIRSGMTIGIIEDGAGELETRPYIRI